jgi:hypothetical protein
MRARSYQPGRLDAAFPGLADDRQPKALCFLLRQIVEYAD